MYFQKADINGDKLKSYLGKAGADEVTGMEDIAGAIATNRLYINRLTGQNQAGATIRFDMLRLELDDMLSLQSGNEVRPLFINEVLGGDMSYLKKSSYHSSGCINCYRPQICGIYDVKAYIRIQLEFGAMPDTTGFNTSISLALLKNDSLYSYLGDDKGITINKQPPQSDPHIIITELDFVMNGADYVNILCGDELSLSLTAELGLYRYEALTGFKVYGYFGASLCDICPDAKEESDVDFYMGI